MLAIASHTCDLPVCGARYKSRSNRWMSHTKERRNSLAAAHAKVTPAHAKVTPMPKLGEDKV